MGKISIVGLGPGDYSLISQGALELLQSSNRIFLRTEKHPTVDQLKQQIDYTSLDYFYEKEENFENVYLHISKFIIDESKKGDLVYAVPGHPRVAEKTVGIIENLAKQNNVEVEVIASMSFVDAMFNYLAVDPADGFRLIDAFELENSPIDPKTNTIITQVYDEFIASNVKIKLSSTYSIFCTLASWREYLEYSPKDFVVFIEPRFSTNSQNIKSINLKSVYQFFCIT